ncbi:MAG: isoleucine--tRNA ligase, partial [Bacilli bacterium]
VKARTIYVKFQVNDGKGLLTKDDSFVIWTTTPWTIPADLAISLNPGYTYGVFETEKGNLIFLESLKDELQKTLELKECKLLKTFKGIDAERITVKHPFYDRDSLVVVGNHVTDDSGTGCVHTAPGHGADDFKVCQKYGIPPLCPVDEKGMMMKECGPRLEGMFYEEANDECVKMLEEKGALLKEVDIVHSYPHDWRTKKPLIFRATPQWFCSISKFRQEALDEIDNNITYYPTWGKVRLHNMIEGREDWCISRQRVWGVPIPIIYNEDGTPIIDKKVFDHIIDLIRENGSNVWFERDAKDLLPEGYTNPASPNGKFVKEKDIMDVWFDSGSSWLGVEIERGLKYPADLILEGSDQYRGWYNSSLILGVATGHKTPFKSILTHGFIVDQNGEKFSKSKGNGMTPDEITSTYGADILRLWSASIDYTMAEIKLSKELMKVVSESYRKIRNSMKFMISNLYDSKDDMIDLSKPYKYSAIDELILAKFDELCVNLHKKYDEYDFIGVTSLVQNFVTNDLSAFYLDYAKDSLYCDGLNSLKRKGIQHVLYRIVKDLAIMLSPILPFTMEEVNKNIPDGIPESIALADFPKPELDRAKITMYNSFMNIRQKTFRELEKSRKNGTLNSNAQAEVTYLTTSDDEIKAMEFLGSDNIVKSLIVAKFSFEKADESNVKIVETKGEKCERCWNYFDELEEDSEGHKICARCHKVLNDE